MQEVGSNLTDFKKIFVKPNHAYVICYNENLQMLFISWIKKVPKKGALDMNTQKYRKFLVQKISNIKFFLFSLPFMQQVPK